MEQNLNKDLIIGEYSQVSMYMPKDIVRVSSKEIPEWIFGEKWNRVYICFAEQRTIYAKSKIYQDLFYDVNVDKTLYCINNINSKRIIVFSTTELWNRVSGPINLDTPYCFEENYYIDSKLQLTEKCKEIDNVVIVYPFNFNSIYRSKDYLFGKIFNSLKNKKIVEIGNTNFYRDIIHTKYVSNIITSVESDIVIGSGRLVYINDYIRDLYHHMGLEYEKFVIEKNNNHKGKYVSSFWLESEEIQYNYDELIIDSLEDLK